MSRPRQTSFVAALLLLSVSFLHAQNAPDPSGHWEGSAAAGGFSTTFQVDLAKNSQGELIGTFTGQDVKNLPLAKVAVEGQSLTFYTRADSPFRGMLSAAGTSVSGEVVISGYVVPASMRRTGAARLEPPPTSAPIGKELEGTWNGTLVASTGPLRLVLTMANQDGRSIGRIVNVDEGGLTIPFVITQKASSVNLESPSVAGSFSGELNAEGTELAGAWTQGGVSLPLTFRRAATESRR